MRRVSNVLLSGRVGCACSRAHLTGLRPPRHSLRSNHLDDEDKQAIKDAAGSGVSIIFYDADDEDKQAIKDDAGSDAGSDCLQS
jgi:hypothetical protein